jgi:AraC-like DNA-binding protein
LALLDQKNIPQQSTENIVAPSDNIKPEDQWFLDKIRHYIEENISNNAANIDEMAAEAATSRSTLNRRLNSIIGITAAQLLIDARMQYAVRLITNERKEKSNISVADIAFRCGYTDPKYFSRCFKQKYGVAPSYYTTKE